MAAASTFAIPELCAEIASHIDDFRTAMRFRLVSKDAQYAIQHYGHCQRTCFLAPSRVPDYLEYRKFNSHCVPFTTKSSLGLHASPGRGFTAIIARYHPIVDVNPRQYMTAVSLTVSSDKFSAPGFLQQMFLRQPPQENIVAQVYVVLHEDGNTTSTYRSSVQCTITRQPGIRLCDLFAAVRRITATQAHWAQDEKFFVAWEERRTVAETSQYVTQAKSNDEKALLGRTDFARIL